MFANNNQSYQELTQSEPSQSEQSGLFVYQGADFTCDLTKETNEQVLLPSGFCEEVQSQVEIDRYPNTRNATHNAILNHMGINTRADENVITIGDDENDVEELGYGLDEMITVSSMNEQDKDEGTEEPMGIFNPNYRDQENRSPSSTD